MKRRYETCLVRLSLFLFLPLSDHHLGGGAGISRAPRHCIAFRRSVNLHQRLTFSVCSHFAMSDPLSVTAAIVAVVTVGFQVAKGLHQLADGIGSVGMEARIYAEEIDSFSKLLQRIKEQVLQQPEQFSSFEMNLLQDIIDVCKRVLHPINRIQEKLNPLLTKFRSSQSWLRAFGLRAQWMFSAKDKLLFYRGALRGQHRLLDTTLELMILKATKDRSPQNIQ